MKSNINDQINYVDQLTWLRGIAAFLVIVSHMLRSVEVGYASNDETVTLWLMKYLDLGPFGVVLFFVLSGCTLYISNGGRDGVAHWKKFYLKRAFRIWPAFAVSLVFYLSFRLIFSGLYGEPQGYWIEKQFLESFKFSDLITYLTLTFNIFGPASLFNNAYWSLPVEFQYYLMFPLAIYLLSSVGIIGPIILGILLYFAPKFGLSFDRNMVFQLAYSFMGGIVIGYLYTKRHFVLNSYIVLAGLLLMITIASYVDNGWVDLPSYRFISDKWNWYVGTGLVSVFLVLFSRISLPVRLAGFLKEYGTISYSTYLYHNLFIAIAVLLMIQFQIHDATLRLGITLFFGLIVTYYAAKYSYRYVEKPAINLGRKL